MPSKKEDILLAQNRPQTQKPDNSITTMDEKVKPLCSLRALRLENNITAKDMVEVIQAIYPKYDKTLQSKVERPEEYGLDLRIDAMNALYRKFSPNMLRAPATSANDDECRESRLSAPPGVRKDRHRFTCKVSCRLPDGRFQLLQYHIRDDGYVTVQDWLSHIITQYLESKGEQNENR